MENWEECTAAARGPAAKRYTLHHKMGIVSRRRRRTGPGPGTCYPDSYGEMTQRAWYAEWLRQMTRRSNGAGRAGRSLMSSIAAMRVEVDCRPGSPLYGEVLEFLYREAELLDSNRYADVAGALCRRRALRDAGAHDTQYLRKGPGFRRWRSSTTTSSRCARACAGWRPIRHGPKRRRRERGTSSATCWSRRAGADDELRRRHELHDHADPRRAGLSAVHRPPRRHAASRWPRIRSGSPGAGFSSIRPSSPRRTSAFCSDYEVATWAGSMARLR